MNPKRTSAVKAGVSLEGCLDQVLCGNVTHSAGSPHCTCAADHLTKLRPLPAAGTRLLQMLHRDKCVTNIQSLSPRKDGLCL